MFTLVNVREYLTSKKLLTPLAHKNFYQQQQQQLLVWAASLPSQTQAQQANKIEQMLTELAIPEIQDGQRLKLMNIVVTASDRLVASLREHYLYERGALNSEQLKYVSQVKSIYYLSLLVYDNILARQKISLNDPLHVNTTTDRRSPSALTKAESRILAATIYQTLVFYQKLLHEQTIGYQPPIKQLWSVLNRLYSLAYQHNILQSDLSTQLATRLTNNIHGLYVQLCLYHLLNIRSMSRANILLVNRSLPIWASHIDTIMGQQTNTRVFVDLQSDGPPEYLTANTTINPYAESSTCLFIDLVPLALYFTQRQQVLGSNAEQATEYRLIDQVLTAINYRYLERQHFIPTRRSPKLNANVITDFNTIHYQIAGGISLSMMVGVDSVSSQQSLRYDTQPKQNPTSANFEVKTFDSTDTTSHFRVLQFSIMPNFIVPTSTKPKKIKSEPTTSTMSLSPALEPQQTDESRSTSFMAALLELNDEVNSIDLSSSVIETSPLPLLMDEIFLLCRPDISRKLKWSIGRVRWLNIEAAEVKVEWQILGHELTACALRLDHTSAHNLNYVPGILIAGDDELQTKPSLLVPSYHFQTHNRVILKSLDTQKSLHLQRCLIRTQGFSQYEFDFIEAELC